VKTFEPVPSSSHPCHIRTRIRGSLLALLIVPWANQYAVRRSLPPLCGGYVGHRPCCAVTKKCLRCSSVRGKPLRRLERVTDGLFEEKEAVLHVMG
jgi:hypothetical protein